MAIGRLLGIRYSTLAIPVIHFRAFCCIIYQTPILPDRTILSMRIALLLFAGLCLVGPAALAQDAAEAPLRPHRSEPRESWQVQQFTTLDGLPSNLVGAILEDRQGFLWIGTRNGLVRYDGYSFQPIRPLRDDSTGGGDYGVGTLHEDAAGYIWTGRFPSINDQGIMHRFDPRTERFAWYQHEEGNPNSLVDEGITSIYSAPFDSESIWIGVLSTAKTGRGGISHLDVATGRFTNYPFFAEDTSTLPHIAVSFLTDLKGRLWSAGWGLNRIESVVDSSTHQPAFTFTSFLPDSSFAYGQPGAAANIIHKLYQSPNNHDVIWAGGPTGLRRFDLNTETFDAFFPYPQGEETAFNSILEDQHGILWLGTSRYGLLNFDPKTGRMTPFEPLAHISRILDLKQDRFGTIWVGSGDGLLKLERRVDPFNVYAYEPNANLIHVRGVYLDRQDMLWVGKPDTLMRIDRKNGETTRYASDPDDPNSIGPEVYKKPYEDRKGDFWIPSGCEDFGYLNKMDRSTERFTRYSPTPDDPTQTRSFCPNAVLEDRQGNFWIVTWGQGLYLMDRQTGRFAHFQHDPDDSGSLADNFLISIYEDHTGAIWLGGGYNMSRFVPPSDPISIDATPNLAFTNSDDRRLSVIRAMLEDRHERFWVATNEGLLRLDIETGRVIEAITTEEGLPSNIVVSMHQDDLGLLWLGTPEGISRFDPESRSFLNFTLRDGLPFDTFIEKAHHQSASGELFFGGYQGVISFFPDELDRSPILPQVLLTGFSIRGVPVEIGTDTPLQQSISNTESITLPYEQNDISFDYVGIHSIDPQYNRYRYWLEGYDPDWVEAGAQRAARYSRLPPGDYVFHVNAANSEGLWNEQGASVRLTITPPWWRTTAMFVVYGLLFVVGVYGVDRFQRRRLLRRAREQARDRELAHAEEIRQAHTELQQAHTNLETAHENLKTTQQQLIQQEKMASLGQLTSGIAHEIKNPLNFINNFAGLSSELVDEIFEYLRQLGQTRGSAPTDSTGSAAMKATADELEEALATLKMNVGKINEHGRRADRIVQAMMKHASGATSERKSVVLNAFVDDYVNLAFHGMRARHPDFSVAIERQYDEAVDRVDMAPEEMGRVLVNLFNNAFDAMMERKAKLDGHYEARLTVATQKNGEAVEIRVSDNGVGIPQQARDKVFEPFFTTKPAGQGTGLGLSLSYDIVTQGHDGSLEMMSEEGEGTTFAVRLRLDT